MPIQPSGSRDAPSASPPEPHGWASQSQRLSLHQGSEGGGGARGPWEDFVSNPPKAAHVALAAPHSARFGNRTNYNMEAAALFALGGVRRGEKVVLVGSHWHYLDILRRVEDLLKAQPPGTVQPSWRKRDIAVFEASGLGSEFFVDGMPDPGRFESFLRKASGPSGRPLRVWNNLGELLHESGSRRASRAVERLWHQFRDAGRCTILCSYLLPEDDLEADVSGLRVALRYHTHLVRFDRDGASVAQFL